METTDSINPVEAITAAVEAQAHTTDIDMLAVKSVNDTLLDASKEPDPEPLYDKLWYQGEVSCFFADSNIGKSLFAVQIAEGIAQRFRVLYLDCELSAKQFQDRYTNKKTGQLHHFPDNFLRATIVPARMDLKDWEDRILGNIEKAALQMKPPVIIVDNIGYLCNNAEKGQDAGTFMMKLLKLKQQYAWSILIIAHTPKRHTWALITQNDLAGSKKLFNYFDSVFAIGLSSKDENFRFVKQLKVRYGGFSYGAGSVMVFELSKEDDMVRFNFLYTEPEKNHLSEPDDNDIIQRDMRVVELHKQGMNYRDIAAQVGISKSMVGKIIAKAEQSTTASTVDSVDKVDKVDDGGQNLFENQESE